MGCKEEGEGIKSAEEEVMTEISTTVESLDGALIFNIVKELVGFVLYMHQQIPSILQDLSLEFNELQTEHKDLGLVLTQTEVASERRKHNGRLREVKQGIKRLEKLMNSISKLQAAVQLMLNENHNIQGVMLILGSNPLRPQHVYEMLFSHGRIVPEQSMDYAKSRISEALSRKAIRALISNDAGSVSYGGPTKLFLLIKAPTTFNLPLHFLPKRDFRYSKKVVPFKLRVKCKVRDQDMATSTDLIWFQCKHVVKGLALKLPHPED